MEHDGNHRRDCVESTGPCFDCRLIVLIYFDCIPCAKRARSLLASLVGLFASLSIFFIGALFPLSACVLSACPCLVCLSTRRFIELSTSIDISRSIRQGVLGAGWWDVECEDDVPPWNEVLRSVSACLFNMMHRYA